MWDVFICHATEDKETFVEGLAKELKERGLKVWYGEFELKIGDSLSRSIDKGLKESRYGVVVLSHAFFSKESPRKELDALLTREVDGRKVILPVLLDITIDEVAKHSAILPDRVFVDAGTGLKEVADTICRTVVPGETDNLVQIETRSSPKLKGDLQCLVGHNTTCFQIIPNRWGCPGIDPRYACLAVQYQYDAVKEFPQKGCRGIERFLPLLPLNDVAFTLNEGNTPLLHYDSINTLFGIRNLYLKDEGRNPTESFKDRKAVVNANIAAAYGSEYLHCVTSGNAGISIATYAHALGLASKHYLVNSRRSLRLERRNIERLGGEVFRDPSVCNDVFKLPLGFDNYNCTPGYDPIGLEGYKVIAWEIWEELGRIPDVVIVPVGSGEGLVGIFKGFLELKEIGRVNSIPKMVAVEPSECGILRNTKGPLDDPHEIGDPSVIWRSHADQLVLQFMPCVRMVLWAIEQSHGGHCAVRNAEIESALDLFINETGLLIEPSSAVVLAALEQGLPQVNPDDTVVAILTGRGSKYANETIQFARDRKTRTVTTVPVGSSIYNIEVADFTDYREILPLYNALIKEGKTTLSTRPIFVDEEADFFSGLGERECVLVVRDPGAEKLHGYGLLLEYRRDLGCSPHIAEVDTYFWTKVGLPNVELALLTEMLGHALSKGYEMAVHECRPDDNVSAYTKLGFVKKTNLNGFYKQNSNRDAILLLELASLAKTAKKHLW